VECVYVAHRPNGGVDKKQYIRALEERVAELESCVSLHGKSDAATDHWDRLEQPEDVENQLSRTIRDHSLNASGWFIGATSNISLGSILGTAFRERAGSVLRSDAEDRAPPHVISSSNPPDNNGSAGRTENNFRAWPATALESAFEAYMKHVALRYPLIHSVRLSKMHSNRNTTANSWEVATLHLVYALGSQYLEPVRAEEICHRFPEITLSYQQISANMEGDSYPVLL
jgi:hypothetical protein